VPALLRRMLGVVTRYCDRGAKSSSSIDRGGECHQALVPILVVVAQRRDPLLRPERAKALSNQWQSRTPPGCGRGRKYV
jgi:hypothetical protein